MGEREKLSMLELRHMFLRGNLKAKLMHNGMNNTTVCKVSSGDRLLAGFRFEAKNHFLTVICSR